MPSTSTGGSNNPRRSMGRPAAAARSASTAPDDTPYTHAVPPATSISAARSSISRSTAYGGVSVLAPRPRRSYVWTANRVASRSASGPSGPNPR